MGLVVILNGVKVWVQLPEIPYNNLNGSVIKLNNEEFIGNLSSIVKILICIIAPAVSVYLGTDENTTIALLTAIVGALFSLVDAKYPNTLISGVDDE